MKALSSSFNEKRYSFPVFLLMSQDAGVAAMAIEAIELSGRILRIVSVRDLKQHHPKSTIQGSMPTPSLVPSSVKFGARKKRVGIP